MAAIAPVAVDLDLRPREPVFCQQRASRAQATASLISRVVEYRIEEIRATLALGIQCGYARKITWTVIDWVEAFHVDIAMRGCGNTRENATKRFKAALAGGSPANPWASEFDYGDIEGHFKVHGN